MKRKSTFWLKFVLVILLAVPVIGVLQVPPHVSEAQTGGAIGYGASVFGSLATGEEMSYTFEGEMGDLVAADVIRMAGDLHLAVTLIGPDGQALVSSERNRLAANSHSAHVAQFLPQAGSYALVVSAVGGTTGDFMLRLHGRAPVVDTPLQYGVPVEVDIPQDAPSRYYSFEAESCATTLTVTNLAEGEPFTFPFVVKVRNENGREVALLRGGDAREDRVTVAALSGRYEVEVLSDDLSMAGAIALLVTCAGQAPGCGGEAAGGMECPACPSCPEELEDGGAPVCENMRVSLIGVDVLGVEITWDAVPGADHYWIHIYGYNETGEVYFGPAGAPADATSFTMDHLPGGFYGFRFVVEAMAGEETLCLGESEIRMLAPPPSDACENFEVTGEVIDNEARTIRWSWTPYDGAAYYAGVMGYDDGGMFAFYGISHYEPETTTVTTEHPRDEVDSDRWILRVVAAGPADEMLCVGEAVVEFTSAPEQVVPPVCAITLLSPREGMANGMQAFYWTEVAGATGYRVRVYNEAGALVAEGTTGPGVNSVVLDVSTAAIGGGFTFHVTVEALLGGTSWCQDGVTELRASEPSGGGESGGGEPPPGGGQPQCYYLVALADPSDAGYAAPLTGANCGNGYAAGTVVDVQANPNGGCWLDHWSGCGASGSANPVSVTMNADCTITAHLACIQ